MKNMHLPNMFRTALFILTMLICSCISVIAADTAENDVQTAERIYMNQTKSITIDNQHRDEDESCYWDYYYKFTPNTSTVYEINSTVLKKNRIEVTDSEGEYIGDTGWDQYTNKVNIAVKLKKGQTYYINVQGNFDGTIESIKTTIKKHSHFLGKNYYNYEDTLKYRQCLCTGCYYRKYVFRNKPEISKLTRGKKSFKMKIKYNKEWFDKFRIEVSTNKKFKNARYANISGQYRSIKVVKGIKRKKTYYVRVRAYVKDKDSEGNSFSAYSPWSKVRKIKTK